MLAVAEAAAAAVAAARLSLPPCLPPPCPPPRVCRSCAAVASRRLWWRRRRPWHRRLPPTPPAGGSLLPARRCLLRGEGGCRRAGVREGVLAGVAARLSGARVWSAARWPVSVVGAVVKGEATAAAAAAVAAAAAAVAVVGAPRLAGRSRSGWCGRPSSMSGSSTPSTRWACRRRCPRRYFRS
ncbi:hypothetical protein I4F81_012639 [Pyropia yezoensis]|uniref:Uncharacterized protein n=1 Tax=Pyropia yezoensis TaxID=2788 RepID=A0ACC3CK11_PYRYE|nr:hypothetical protein I4F81_012639 [Neopyropia yezoensis]